jgi:hypothetical protein
MRYIVRMRGYGSIKFGRRDALKAIGGASAIVATMPTKAISQGRRKMRQFPPFELQASAADMLSLRAGVRGYATDGVGPSPSMVWIKAANDTMLAVGVDSRDLEFKFEVFTLALETEQALAHRVLTAPPVKLPDDAPEMMKQWASMPRVAPKPPADFKPWPFDAWRVEVLRRAEYIIGDLQPPPETFGNDPVARNPARPGEVPPEAWAACDVAVGLLFSGSGGKRLMVAADWMPFNLIVTQDEPAIVEFIESCATIDVEEYVKRVA